MSTYIQRVPTLVSQTPCRRARKTQRCCRLCVREWKTMHRWLHRRVRRRRRRHTHHGGGELWAWPWRAKKTVLFYSRLQHRTTKAGDSNRTTLPCHRIATTAWRGLRRRHRELQLRLHRVPHFFVYLMQWKTNQVQAGGKMALKTLFLKRERRHFFAPWLAQYPILMAGDLTKTCLESHKENQRLQWWAGLKETFFWSTRYIHRSLWTSTFLYYIFKYVISQILI